MSIARLMQTARAGVSAPPAGNPWDVSSAVFNGTPPFNTFSIIEDTNPTGVFFKPDGTKMYISGNQGNDVNEYNLGTAWDITTVSYLQNFSVNLQDGYPRSLFFKPDGTKMYIVGNISMNILEYNLGTAWDISTASYLQNFYVGGQDSSPSGVSFKPDGTKMYMLGDGYNQVYEYNISTAWDISTASHALTASITAQESTPEGLFFKDDGTKMYVIGITSDSVHEYNLSTPWDINTVSFLQSFSVGILDTNPTGVFFKPDGTEMYFTGNSFDRVYKYNLSTPWDISTAVYTLPTTEYFNVVAEENQPKGLFFKPDGTKMYVMGPNGDDVNEYDLSVAWDIATASYLQNFSIVNQETNPTGLFFKDDGTKMYAVGNAGNDVNEYNLSTPWNVTTASFLHTYSVGIQEPNPTGIFFKPDGTKMYVTGYTGDDVFEYDLSTAWDVSTASYLQNFSVAGQEGTPHGLFFKPDGTKMYVVGTVNNRVFEYNLSTPWNVTTANYFQQSIVSPSEVTSSAVFFKPDGTKMFVMGYTGDAILAYDL